jgi:hypothetical protein
VNREKSICCDDSTRLHVLRQYIYDEPGFVRMARCACDSAQFPLTAFDNVSATRRGLPLGQVVRNSHDKGPEVGQVYDTDMSSTLRA